MAEIVDAFPEQRGRVGYPWNEWLDGKIRKLTQGEGKDFTCKPENLRVQVYDAARKRNGKARVAVADKGKTIFVQFYVPEKKD